jgi:hypothetical protein
MRAEWQCDWCGPVEPLHVVDRLSAEILAAVLHQLRGDDGDAVPLWCPWPLPPRWTVTGVAWAGDERRGPRATAVALSGPAPVVDGPADLVFVAEEPGIGLGPSLAGIAGPDPGGALGAVRASRADAKVKAAGHPTPLWAVKSLEDRSAYAGEAMGRWLYAVAWPATAGYLLAEEITLMDLGESLPAELVYGAPSNRLRPSSPSG